MQPAKILAATHTLVKPKDWDTERYGECDDLAVRVTDGVYASAWRPSPEELATLMSGGVVILHVFSGQPPVSLTVEAAVQSDQPESEQVAPG